MIIRGRFIGEAPYFAVQIPERRAQHSWIAMAGEAGAKLREGKVNLEKVGKVLIYR